MARKSYYELYAYDPSRTEKGYEGVRVKTKALIEEEEAIELGAWWANRWRSDIVMLVEVET